MKRLEQLEDIEYLCPSTIITILRVLYSTPSQKERIIKGRDKLQIYVNLYILRFWILNRCCQFRKGDKI
jgi:hypothetical protein